MGMLKNIVKRNSLRNGFDDDQKSTAKKLISLGLSVLKKMKWETFQKYGAN